MGPLTGVRVVELSGIGPGPFCGMLLSDMGAEVVRVERREVVTGQKRALKDAVVGRGRRSIGVDLKHPDGLECVLRLVDRADAIIEGFRPGVTERLGLGPDDCLARNPRLVYGRMTGWGQNGPLAARAGHDINYISLAGALYHFGREGEAPVFPINLVGDFGGGGMLLALGIACALLEAGRSGKGQVVDAAMVEGASLLAAMFSGFLAAKSWSEERGVNILDTGAPWYDVYETRDGKYVSIGAIEAKFHAELLSRLNLRSEDLPGQYERARWPEMREVFARAFRTRTRDEWCAIFEGSDACFAPVLSFSESRNHPHNAARASFVDVTGVPQPAPAPRFSRTPGAVRGAPPERGQGGRAALADWGFSAAEVERLRSGGLHYKD
jgi:alpha-methylacyl-CoA racemase